VLLPRSEAVGRDYRLVRRGGRDAEAEKDQDVGDSAKGWKGVGRGQEVSQGIGRNPGGDSAAECSATGTTRIPRAIGDSDSSFVTMGPVHDKLPGPDHPCSGGEE
jgi:hypothetical protein